MKKILAMFVLFFVVGISSAFAFNFNVELNGVYSNQKNTNLRNFVGKKPLLVVFFYPQCPPCEKEAKNVNRIYEEYKKSILVIGVSLSKDRYDIEDFVDDLNIKYPVYRVAKKGQLRNVGGILATPTSILINKDGKIICKVLGAVDFKVMESKIKKCIK